MLVNYEKQAANQISKINVLILIQKKANYIKIKPKKVV
jgi:hypothetical protein